MSDAPSFVAPRKALRSCPTSLARLSTLSRRCVQTARDSLCRSHPFSDVPCRSSSSPRALPRTRTAFATRIRKWYFAFTRFAERLSRSPLFKGQAVLPRNVFRRVSVPRTLGAWCMLRARPARGLLAASAPCSLACPFSFASTSSRTSIRASPPRPRTLPKKHDERASTGTSYRRLQPTFFRCQRRAALMRLVSLPVSLLRAFARFTPRWSAPFHGEHTPLRRVFCACGRALSSRSAPRKPYL